MHSPEETTCIRTAAAWNKYKKYKGVTSGRTGIEHDSLRQRPATAVRCGFRREWLLDRNTKREMVLKYARVDGRRGIHEATTYHFPPRAEMASHGCWQGGREPGKLFPLFKLDINRNFFS